MEKANKTLSFFFLLVAMFIGFTQNAYAQSNTMQDTSVEGFLDILAENAGKRAVFINFYASWCGPCKREMPHLIEIRNKYSEEDLLIIGINLDASAKEMKDFNERMGVNYPTFHDDKTLATAYGVRAIPFSVLYDKSGKAVFARAGILSSETLSEIIDKALIVPVITPDAGE